MNMPLDRYGMGIKYQDEVFYVGDEVVIQDSAFIGLMGEIKAIYVSKGRFSSDISFIISAKIKDEEMLEYFYNIFTDLCKEYLPFHYEKGFRYNEEDFKKYIDNLIVTDTDQIGVVKPYYLRKNVKAKSPRRNLKWCLTGMEWA